MPDWFHCVNEDFNAEEPFPNQIRDMTKSFNFQFHKKTSVLICGLTHSELCMHNLSALYGHRDTFRFISLFVFVFFKSWKGCMCPQNT